MSSNNSKLDVTPLYGTVAELMLYWEAKQEWQFSAIEYAETMGYSINENFWITVRD